MQKDIYKSSPMFAKSYAYDNLLQGQRHAFIAIKHSLLYYSGYKFCRKCFLFCLLQALRHQCGEIDANT